MQEIKRSLAPALMVVAAWYSGPAIAIEGGIDPVDVVQKKTLTAQQAPNPLGLKAVDAKTLAARRGGTEVLNDMTLKGVVSDTRASNLSTGNNVIADGTNGAPSKRYKSAGVLFDVNWYLFGGYDGSRRNDLYRLDLREEVI